MKKLLHGFGKFYSKVIVNFIGIFIFVGILSVVFGECGWIPNKNIYAISQFVYQSVIPIMIAYAAGNQAGDSGGYERSNRLQAGGSIAVMATAGMLLADAGCGILGAMLLGPLSGMLWKKLLEPLVKKGRTGLEMLTRNAAAALAGSVMAVLAFYLVAPAISICVNILLLGLDYLIEHKLIWLASVLIEPAKVLFLNNSIHHGILLPLGMQQAERTGESILFLLETNPGPGLGILGALYFLKKEKRGEYAASIFVEFIGGVHEIYFPEILSNMRLILALISGGAAGNFCFLALDGAAAAAVSPGSIITILLVCSKNRIFSVLFGILVSAAVSAAVAGLLLTLQKKHEKITEISTEKQMVQEVSAEKTMIQKVGFICNAGVGSSAMGAALFRKKLREMNITGVEVDAYAADQMPGDLNLVVCQKDLKELLLPEIKAERIYTVDSLLNQAEYMVIIEELEKEQKE